MKEYSDRYPKAVASLLKDEEKLLTFYDFPAAHWQTIRSTNVIESAFATVKLRQRVTKGAGTRTRGLTMAFKLLDMAEKRWRRIRSPHLVQRVLDGTKFLDGRTVTEETEEKRKSAARSRADPQLSEVARLLGQSFLGRTSNPPPILLAVYTTGVVGQYATSGFE